MKIVIVYGNERKGSTYNCVKILKDKLESYSKVDFKEFFLPRDLPHFCRGCFNCFLKGEEKCPHYESVQPLVEEILSCDGIILASPVYGMSVTSSMKACLDHLCYMWMPHRPNENMFSKIGFIVSTTAGAGLKSCTKTMADSLKFWGVRRIYTFGTPVAASNWGEVKTRKKKKIEKQLNKKAKEFYRAAKNRKKLKSKLMTKVLFHAMKGMIKKYNNDNYDKKYWDSKGWLNNVKPF